MKNSKGHSLVLLLALVPLFGTLVCSFVLFIYFQQLKALPKQFCRNENLKIQEISSKSLHQLMELNSKVRELRIERTAALEALSSAMVTGIAPAIARASLWLKQVQVRQKGLSLLQKSILIHQQLETKAVQTQLARELGDELRKWNKKTLNLAEAQLLQFESMPHRLAVAGEHPSVEPPIMNIEQPFFRRQTSESYWRLHLKTEAPFFRNFLSTSNISWRDQCKASLIENTQGEKKWTPVLVEVI